MNKIFSTILIAAATLALATSCMDNFDAPSTPDAAVLAPEGTLGAVNVTIGQIKKGFCSGSANAEFKRNNYNYYTEVKHDSIFTAVVAANDISGNLYQTILLRNIESDGTDQSILLKVRNTCLYPYFKLGQRVKVNLKGLWVGVYSDIPTIGQPYKTSSGNLNLGPMAFELCQTNIEAVGTPDENAPELVPFDYTGTEGDAWLRATANKVVDNYPALATVEGTIDEVQGATAAKAEKGTEDDVLGEAEPIKEVNGNYLKIFAPYALHDGGYGVSRTISLKSNNSNVTLRTSTKNDISYRYLPKDSRKYTGILQYDSYNKAWQIQLRSIDDVSPALPTNQELEEQLSKQ